MTLEYCAINLIYRTKYIILSYARNYCKNTTCETKQ